ncbi:MAG: aminotransferase class V-fold PLP-dependent enzyme [Phycisphaerales bacterium]|nr:MAG: aminotransferase class V-fold PLP-dependent enzyme [Phycisphaerales bacterium]
MLTLDKNERLAMWDRVIAGIEDYIDTLPGKPCAMEFGHKELRDKIGSIDFNTPMTPAEAVDFAADALREYQVHVPHPRYYGLFNPAPATASIAADALVAAFNPQLATWHHNPIGCEIERHLIRSIAERFGYSPEETDGSFTSGGAEANHTALLTALVDAFPEYAAGGLRALDSQPVLYASAESHHSISKAARLCGLGAEAVRSVPVDQAFRMIPDELTKQIHRDRAEGLLPFFVVATIGSTNAGVIDPISAIADVARDESLWFHADAAWGGAAVLVPGLRSHLAGIERADSIIFDAHKWLATPMGAGMYFTRHPDILHRTFALSADYMPTGSREIDAADPYERSMQCSRRFIGLKLFLSLLVAGWEGYEKMIRRHVEMGDLLRSRLGASSWAIVNDTPLPLVCFVDDTGPCGDEEPRLKAIADEIVTSGRAWISSTRIGGSKPVLRVCIMNHRTVHDDIEALVHDLNRARDQIGGQNSK